MAQFFIDSVEEIGSMEQGKKHTLRAATRCEMLTVAQYHAITGVGAQLVRAEAPKAYAAYKRLMKSIEVTIRHARRQRIREED